MFMLTTFFCATRQMNLMGILPEHDAGMTVINPPKIVLT